MQQAHARMQLAACLLRTARAAQLFAARTAAFCRVYQVPEEKKPALNAPAPVLQSFRSCMQLLEPVAKAQSPALA